MRVCALCDKVLLDYDRYVILHKSEFEEMKKELKKVLKDHHTPREQADGRTR